MVPLVSTLRTRLLFRSAMYRFPAPSTARPDGWLSCADVAAPPSPGKPALPVPATVVMTPVEDTSRTRLSSASAMYIAPPPPKAIAEGQRRAADVAAPPSPRPLFAAGLPATDVITPEESTLRTRLSP